MDQDQLKKLRWIYTILITILVTLAFVVPYTLMNNINLFRAAFLFWMIFALCVIFLTIKITSYWRNN